MSNDKPLTPQERLARIYEGKPRPPVSRPSPELPDDGERLPSMRKVLDGIASRLAPGHSNDPPIVRTNSKLIRDGAGRIAPPPYEPVIAPDAIEATKNAIEAKRAYLAAEAAKPKAKSKGSTAATRRREKAFAKKRKGKPLPPLPEDMPGHEPSEPALVAERLSLDEVVRIPIREGESFVIEWVTYDPATIKAGKPTAYYRALFVSDNGRRSRLLSIRPESLPAVAQAFAEVAAAVGGDDGAL